MYHRTADVPSLKRKGRLRLRLFRSLPVGLKAHNTTYSRCHSIPITPPGYRTLARPLHLLSETTFTTALQNLTSRHDLDPLPYDTDLPYLDKGKARDTPPTLPPLAFPPISFDICPSSPSLISEPGPSSYGSLHPHHIEHESFSYTPPVLRNSTTHGAAHMLPPASPRRRSFSNPPFRHLERLISSSVRTRGRILSRQGASMIALYLPRTDGKCDPHRAFPELEMQVPTDLDASRC